MSRYLTGIPSGRVLHVWNVTAGLLHTCRWDRVRVQREWRGGGGARNGRTQVDHAWSFGSYESTGCECLRQTDLFIYPTLFSSIINIPGESTLRRDFLRLQLANKERSEALRRQQLEQQQNEGHKHQLLAERQKRIEEQKEQRRRLEEVRVCVQATLCLQ